jgi:hypothetical protein
MRTVWWRAMIFFAALAWVTASAFAASEILFIKGDPVPGAGQAGTGIPADAIWTDFGAPAINDAGQVAFVGHWRPLSGSGMFVSGSLLVNPAILCRGWMG